MNNKKLMPAALAKFGFGIGILGFFSFYVAKERIFVSYTGRIVVIGFDSGCVGRP